MSLISNDLFAVSRGGKLFSVTSDSLKSAYSSEPVVKIGPNPPSNPVPGTLWWSTLEGNLFIWYDDGDSSQWADASPAFVELDYLRLEAYIDQSVLDSAVSEIKPGNGILVSPSNGKGTVTITVDPSIISNPVEEFTEDQQRQDDKIAELESAVIDLSDRLSQLEDLIANTPSIDGGYPNAQAIYDEPDTNGGDATDEFTQLGTDGGTASTL